MDTTVATMKAEDVAKGPNKEAETKSLKEKRRFKSSRTVLTRQQRTKGSQYLEMAASGDNENSPPKVEAHQVSVPCTATEMQKDLSEFGMKAPFSIRDLQKKVVKAQEQEQETTGSQIEVAVTQSEQTKVVNSGESLPENTAKLDQRINDIELGEDTSDEEEFIESQYMYFNGPEAPPAKGGHVGMQENRARKLASTNEQPAKPELCSNPMQLPSQWSGMSLVYPSPLHHHQPGAPLVYCPSLPAPMQQMNHKGTKQPHPQALYPQPMTMPPFAPMFVYPFWPGANQMPFPYGQQPFLPPKESVGIDHENNA